MTAVHANTFLLRLVVAIIYIQECFMNLVEQIAEEDLCRPSSIGLNCLNW